VANQPSVNESAMAADIVSILNAMSSFNAILAANETMAYNLKAMAIRRK
jgi:hypothetical protein